MYHEIDEDYQDFLEDIKILKENHVMLKGHERTQSKVFKRIADKFKKSLTRSNAIKE